MMTTARSSLIASTFAVLSLMAVGCASTTAQAESAHVVSVAQQQAELSTFTKLVQQAGLTETLAQGSFTVFAPSDDAFKAVPAATLDKLSKDPELLKSVLTFHVVPGKTEAAAVTGSAAVATVNGAKINLSKAGDFVTVEDGMVIKADVQAGQSVIHVVDRVLMPPVKK